MCPARWFILLMIVISLFLQGSDISHDPDSGREQLSFRQNPLLVPDNEMRRGPVIDFHGTVTLPIKRAGKLIILEGVADSVSGNFILDTGAEGLVLNKTYFREMNRVYGTQAGGVTGSTGEVYRKKISEFKLGDLCYKELKATLTDLGHIENRRGFKVLGLIGADLFKEYELVISLVENSLKINSTTPEGIPENPQERRTRSGITQGFINHDHLILIKVKIGGRGLQCCLDTGAEMSIIDSKLPAKVLETITLHGQTYLRGVGPDRIRVQHGVMNELVIGEKTFSGIPTLIADLESMGNYYGIGLDGMLGFDIFELGTVHLNFKKRELMIDLHQ